MSLGCSPACSCWRCSWWRSTGSSAWSSGDCWCGGRSARKRGPDGLALAGGRGHVRPKRAGPKKSEEPMRRIGLALGAVALIATQSAHAQAIEKSEVALAVGGKSGLYYLPLTITERLGYFKE